MFYSATTDGFYDSNIHTTIPDDAVSIPKDYYFVLLEARSNGKIITIVDNWPTIQDAPPPSVTALMELERAWRNTELIRADIELNKVQDGMGFGTVTQWREYRCALRNWPENEFFPDSSKRPVAPDIQ